MPTRRVPPRPIEAPRAAPLPDDGPAPTAPSTPSEDLDARSAGPHLLDNVVVFVRLLRRLGVAVTPEQTAAFCRALEWIDLGDRGQVFWTARALLVNRREDLALFDGAFDALFRRRAPHIPGPRLPPAPRHPPRERRLHLVSLLAQRAGADDPEIEVVDKSRTYSDAELLQQKDFSELTPDELAAVRRAIDAIRWKVSERRSHRLTADRRGRRLHLRGVLRQAVRHGGAVLRLPRLRRKVKPRPLVLLADVSGSMERYSRILLQLFYCASRALPGVESFVFGTRLTRITPQLRLRNVDRALDLVSRRILDFAGGTRIGASLGEFNRRWARRVLRRGAVVLVVSDGWERGDVGELRRELRFLRDRCHRLIWLNPLLGRPDYEPLVEGMAAALPLVDDFLPVHDLQALSELVERLRSLPVRRTGRAGRPLLSGSPGENGPAP